eukprot:CAMPEP_0197669124 /NCGR_PEP_ID=MMETSP1338-20131121/71186_1 /TAXON_ID=43686 ORGANISM="Pelagodinium beii, Strain RCC1491" /NCGR_SAMPLE_ID=MMETSP1338 /ASSEMBLY_ACC=CAM_ASM_000754 /LENGTH=149 /DNA_ID=CAMNT_0043248619 /DNA_START=114 /DNA_END=563 /DNA_ORIENTATION=-
MNEIGIQWLPTRRHFYKLKEEDFRSETAEVTAEREALRSSLEDAGFDEIFRAVDEAFDRDISINADEIIIQKRMHEEAVILILDGRDESKLGDSIGMFTDWRRPYDWNEATQWLNPHDPEVAKRRLESRQKHKGRDRRKGKRGKPHKRH